MSTEKEVVGPFETCLSAFALFTLFVGSALAMALAIMLSDNQLANNYRWAVPWLWVLAGVSAAACSASACWLRRLFISETVSQEVIKQEVNGSGNRQAGRDHHEINYVTSPPNKATDLTTALVESQCLYLARTLREKLRFLPDSERVGIVRAYANLVVEHLEEQEMKSGNRPEIKPSRPEVWLGQWSWQGGASGLGIFSNRTAANKFASSNAQLGGCDWSNFPSPALQYPYEDRDGTEVPELDPLWVIHWPGGKASVSRMKVADDWQFGSSPPPLPEWSTEQCK